MSDLNPATHRPVRHGGNYSTPMWTLIFFLFVNIALDIIFIVLAVTSLQGALIWNIIVTVVSILTTPPLTSYLSALKKSRSVPARSTKSKILPNSLTNRPRPLFAYGALAALSTLWITAALSLCILLGKNPKAVSDDDDSVSSDSGSSSSSPSVGSSSDPNCVGLNCRRAVPSKVFDVGNSMTSHPAIASAILGWVFLLVFVAAAIDLWRGLKYWDGERRRGVSEGVEMEKEGAGGRVEEPLMSGT